MMFDHKAKQLHNDELLKTQPSGSDTPTMVKDNPLMPSPATAKHWMKKYRTEVAASTSTVFSTLIPFPLDTIKTNMQSSDDKFRVCAMKIYRGKGWQGFYPGVLVPLFSVTLVRTVTFSTYQKVKYKMSSMIGRATGQEEPLITVNRPGSLPTAATIACFTTAGAAGGFVGSFFACPFELTKATAQMATQMAKDSVSGEAGMAARSYQNKGTLATAREILKTRGKWGLYTGLRYHIVRDTIGSAIFFPTYESTKQLLVKYQGKSSPTSPSAVAVAGGLCGVVSWVITYPLDTAKTNFQRNCVMTPHGKPFSRPSFGYWEVKQYRGLAVSLSRTCLTNIVFFSCFEFAKKRINSLEDPIAK